MNRSNSSTPTHSITSEDLSEYSPSLGEMLLNEMDQSHNQHNNFNPSDLCQKDDELADMSASSCADDVDLYTQLAQKDHDLMLAAELGKALLEKNDELMRRHEQLVEEYTLKVEDLTQEKHALKLKLDNLRTEYDSTVRELQNDISLLHDALEERQSESKNGNREKFHIIEELHQQNEKLSAQLKKAYDSEKDLRIQVRTLHDEMDLRRHTMQDSLQCMESLRTEVTSTKDKKCELDSRVRQLTGERRTLTEHLDEAQDRVKDLLKVSSEKQQQISELETTVEQLQERNFQLQNRLSNTPQCLTSLEGGSTLFSELNMSGLAQAMSTESLDDPGAIRIGQQEEQQAFSNNNNHHHHQQTSYGVNFYSTHDYDPSIMFEDDDIEYDDIDISMVVHPDDQIIPIIRNNSRSISNYHSPQHLSPYHGIRYENSYLGTASGSESPDVISQHTLRSNLSRDSLDYDDEELRQEILEVYRQLHHLVMDLRGCGEEWSPETLQLEDMKVGSLLCVMKELRSLVEQNCGTSIASKDSLESRSSREREEELQAERLSKLKLELVTAESEVVKYRAAMECRENKLKRQTEQITSLERKLLKEQEINDAVMKERDDLIDGKLEFEKDDVINRAREERNDAIEMKNKTEIELAKARLDTAHLDQQLMEAIQQKLERSQQLELWQVDMQELIDTQVTKRIKDEKRIEDEIKSNKARKKMSNSSSPFTGKKRFSLFKR